MEKAKEAAERIKRTFVKNMNLMTPYKRSHFAIRIFRAEGKKDYNHYIKENFEAIKGALLEDIEKCDDRNHALKRAEVFFQALNKNNDRKGIERQRVFSNKKEELFCFSIIELDHIWNEMGFIEKEKHNKWINFLKTRDLKSMFLDDEVFRHYSAQLATFVFLLKFNKVIDIEEDFRKKFIKVFMCNEKLDDYEYRNKIYTLTHFIIGASNYYQQFVPAEKFGWILDYFRQNIDEILKRTNADIIAEVGLCFRLCRVNEGKEIKPISEYLIKEIDREKGYIPRKDGSLEKSEHANSVAYMFLMGFGKLYKGPYFK
ncbi:DUF3541 domain-containing protein [Candidatus Woesearchaeota archaeon]|nr:DUF3541 domain-containing protein [Candidatus Woesearchaeota archaeon]